jgi:tRNA threonylcarbamoyladenosine modification (KEOPS) complex  Pcc1 subunit
MIFATIKSYQPKHLIKDVFSAEDKSFKTGRASYSLKTEGRVSKFSIKALDPTSMKAAKRAINNTLRIIHQMQKV